jgi:hypothetical protein
MIAAYWYGNKLKHRALKETCYLFQDLLDYREAVLIFFGII